MKPPSMDVSTEYNAARARANLENFGQEVVDLPAVRRAYFEHGYAQCLIDQRKAAIPKIPALVPDQPAGCQCAANSWGVEGFMPICDNYEECQFGDCKHCNHDKACHSPESLEK